MYFLYINTEKLSCCFITYCITVLSTFISFLIRFPSIWWLMLVAVDIGWFIKISTIYMELKACICTIKKRIFLYKRHKQHWLKSISLAVDSIHQNVLGWFPLLEVLGPTSTRETFFAKKILFEINIFFLWEFILNTFKWQSCDN